MNKVLLTGRLTRDPGPACPGRAARASRRSACLPLTRHSSSVSESCASSVPSVYGNLRGPGVLRRSVSRGIRDVEPAGGPVAVIGIIASACAPAAGSPGASSSEPTPPTSTQASAAPGTIEFGTGGTECSLTGKATTFPTSATFRLVAILNGPWHAGEPNSMFVAGPGGTDELKAPPPPAFTHCIYNDVTPGLPPGHYVIEMRAGSEVLAKGAYDITP